jgi:release factor glutamine methyltransferase
MRKIIKRFASFFLIPLTKWYLRKERVYHYKNITVKILPGVFHPGLFYSTKFVLEFLADEDLKNKTFLELGCGTGLISIAAAKAGAHVTSSDLSTKAIENIILNKKINHVEIKTIHSDLFDSINEVFDFIIINPPYYGKEVSNENELCWNCGKEFEYFEKLFRQLTKHINNSSSVIMVLTKGCDLQRIFAIAKKSNFDFELIKEKDVLFDEKDFLFRIKAVVA